MKLLQKEFVANVDKTGDMKFIQLRKDKGVALYERRRFDKSLFGYEVFIVKTVEAGSPLPGGSTVEETYEQYPGASAFGKTAYAPATLERAEEMFDQLVERVKVTKANPGRRGRVGKSNTVTVTVPVGKFTMNQWVEESGQDYFFLRKKMKKLLNDGRVQKVGTEKNEGSRGKAKIIYKLVNESSQCV